MKNKRTCLLALLILLSLYVVPAAAYVFTTSTNDTVDVVNYQPFVDWKIWATFLILSFVCMVASHAMPRGNEFWAFLGFVFMIVAVWTSIGLAIYNQPVAYDTGNTSIGEHNVTFQYSVRNISSTWLTIVMIILAALAFLNIIYVYVEIVQKRTQQYLRQTRGQQEIGQQEMYQWQK